MSTSEGCKSLKHERVTRVITAAAAAVFKASAQTAMAAASKAPAPAATALKVLEEMASMAPE